MQNTILNKPIIISNKKEKNINANEPPKRTILEEIGNSITHGVGALIAIYVLIIMIIKSTSPLMLIASLVYGISMFLTMIMSCLYHAFKSESKVKRLWRRFDYSCIYLLIGGTYAPLFLIYLGNTLGIILFCIQWSLIILGITMVAIFGPGKVKILNYILYFLIGWAGILFIPEWINTERVLLSFILFGGIAYTLGMIPFGMKIKGSHFIWHFFVLLGCILQWTGIFICLY